MLRKIFEELFLSYEDRLKPAEKDLYDRFTAAQKDGGQFLLAFQQCHPQKELHFLTVPKEVFPAEYLREEIKNNPDQYVKLILSFDLKKDFRSQWCQKPGHINNLDFLKQAPLLRAGDLSVLARTPPFK